jgi:hypothetical protein
LPLKYVTDFQIVQTAVGLVFLDFEAHFANGPTLFKLMNHPRNIRLRSTILDKLHAPTQKF